MIDKSNFFDNTSATWELLKEVNEITLKTPDYVSFKRSRPFPLVIRNSQKYKEQNGLLSSYLDDNTCISFVILSQKKRGCTTKYILDKIDKEISSQYWFSDKGVYRRSNHWGYVYTCKWRLNSDAKKETLVGFCKWEDFEQIEYKCK